MITRSYKLGCYSEGTGCLQASAAKTPDLLYERPCTCNRQSQERAARLAHAVRAVFGGFAGNRGHAGSGKVLPAAPDALWHATADADGEAPRPRAASVLDC